jgi:putative FmdB family regulatory protein
MPNYDFRCTACKKTFTATMTWTQFDKKRGKAKCPKCGKSRNVEQLIGSQMVKTSKKS